MKDIEKLVKRLIAAHLASSWTEGDLHDDLSFLNDGLALDSVEIVELLFACENRFGIRISPELIESTPFTIGTLITFIKNDVIQMDRQ